MAFTAVQFWQFAEEAMRRALLSKSEIEKQALMDLAQTWTQAAFRSETVQSEETRLHLHDAHNRVMSVAAVQRQLHASRGVSAQGEKKCRLLLEQMAMIFSQRRVASTLSMVSPVMTD
jgi:two-component sensor histidine kinase